MTARIASLVLVFAIAALGAAVPAVAAGPDAATVVAQEQAQEGPAVDLPPVAEPDETPPWTTRYLVPTGLALTVIVVVAVAVGWGWKRSRYHVTE